MCVCLFASSYFCAVLILVSWGVGGEGAKNWGGDKVDQECLRDREQKKKGKNMETLVIETRTSSLQRKRSTTELHPLNFLSKVEREKFWYKKQIGENVNYSKIPPSCLPFFLNTLIIDKSNKLLGISLPAPHQPTIPRKPLKTQHSSSYDNPPEPFKYPLYFRVAKILGAACVE